MSIYVVGDVQGCSRSLLRLLDKVRFDEAKDELWFCGDLVNRGPNSVDILRFASELQRTRVVLGNHDLHLLAVAGGFRKSKRTDSFDDVLRAPDHEELLGWLRGQPLAHFDETRRLLLVHAGLHPRWGLAEGLAQAREVEELMANDETCNQLLQRMYGNDPWADREDLYDRARWTINAFTRMRFCHRDGTMDFDHFGPPGSQPPELHPWFDLRGEDDFRIIFGHWSMLGAGVHRNAIALDSGCVHGGQLTIFDPDAVPMGFTRVSCIDQA